MNEEYKELMRKMKKKKHSEKEPWEKYLEVERRKERRKQAQQYEYEVLLDPAVFDYKEF